MQKRPLASPASSFRRSAARQRRVFTAPPTSAAPQRSQPPRSRSATDMMSSEDDEELFITPPAPAFPSRGSDRHDYSPAVSPGPPGAPRGRGLPARSRSLPRPVRPPSLSSLSLGIPTALPPSQQYADEASDGEGDGDYYESRTWALYDKVRDLRPDRQLASPLDESGRDPDDTNGGAPDDDGLFEMEGE